MNVENVEVILFKHEEKKHSVVYRNTEEGWSGVYIPKDILGPRAPERIRMKLEDATLEKKA